MAPPFSGHSLIAPVNSAASTVAPCPGAPLSRLKVGARGDVRPAAAGNVPNLARVRDQPTTTARLIVNLKEGVPFTVTDGPQCGENFVWWKIKSDDGFTGWIAEGDAAKYYVRPLGLEAVETPVILSTAVPGGTATAVPVATLPPPTSQVVQSLGTLAPPPARVAPIADIPLTSTPFFGRPSEVFSVAFAPNGRYVLSGHSDGTMRLWLIETATQLRIWNTQTAITAVQFSPDGASVYATAFSSVTRYNVATGAVEQSYATSNDWIHNTILSPDGTLLMSVSDSGAAYIWDTRTGSQVRTLIGHYQAVWGAAISPNDKFAITGSADHTAVLWNLETGAELQRLAIHTDGVNTADFSPDGTQALTASVDGTIRLWDVSTGLPVSGVNFIRVGSSIRVAQFSHDGKRILTGSFNHLAQIWDVTTGRELVRFSTHDDYVDAIAFSPDDRSVVTGSPDKTVRVWDVATSMEIRRFPPRPN